MTEQDKKKQNNDGNGQSDITHLDVTHSSNTATRRLSQKNTKTKKVSAKPHIEIPVKEPSTALGKWWFKLQQSPDRIKFGMCIVAMGVVYGDIGTSPLYTMQTFLNDQGGLQRITRFQVLGMLSLLFWSIFLVVTVKYVVIAMRISNKGEGGIFALYTMVKHYARWLIVPAMIGGAAFFADSVLTPAVSISSAVGGLRSIPQIRSSFSPAIILTITIVIIVLLFLIQSHGTVSLGRVFGTVIVTWFVFIAFMGIYNLSVAHEWILFEALNPIFGIHFLFSGANKAGIALMGTVFLATTGGEAIYSDMGHVGRGSIYATWPFINISLILCYFGQGAWILHAQSNSALYRISEINPFFQMMPGDILRIAAILISVAAGIIASQALITGAFSMVSEATTLNWMPHLQVRYPADTRGQLYIPTVNTLLCCATIITLLIFQTSEHLSSAYGLALTITMFMNTLLLGAYLWFAARKKVLSVIFEIVFLTLQALFLIASCAKFAHGGWFTMILTILYLIVMYSWYRGTKVERSQRRHFKPREFLPALDALRHDDSIPYYADNVAYLTSDTELRRLDTDVFYSIYADTKKRARAWWVISVEVTDDPFTREYSVENFGTDYLFRVRMRLGFKIDQNIPVYLRQIMNELIDSGMLSAQSMIHPIFDRKSKIGTIKYVLIRKELVPESKITATGITALRVKYAIRSVVGETSKWFGLTAYNPLVEIQPMFVARNTLKPLKRVNLRKTRQSITLQQVMAELQQEHSLNETSQEDSDVLDQTNEQAAYSTPAIPLIVDEENNKETE